MIYFWFSSSFSKQLIVKSHEYRHISSSVYFFDPIILSYLILSYYFILVSYYFWITTRVKTKNNFPVAKCQPQCCPVFTWMFAKLNLVLLLGVLLINKTCILKHFFQEFDLCPGIKCETDSIATSSRSCKTFVKKFEKEMKMKLLHDQEVKCMLKFNTKVLDSSV